MLFYQKRIKNLNLWIHFFMALSLTFLGLFLSLPSRGESIGSFKKKEAETRLYMIEISRQLGVTCNHCHVVNDFSLNTKKNKIIAKEHIQITQMLIDHGMNGNKGKPKASCYMCHQGQAKPNYKEPYNPLTETKDLLKNKNQTDEIETNEPIEKNKDPEKGSQKSEANPKK